MRLHTIVRILGLLMAAASAWWVTLYVGVILDSSPTQIRWPRYLNGGVLIGLHAAGVVAGIGLLTLQKWSRSVAVAYLGGLLVHGAFWWIRRPRFDFSVLDLTLLALILLALAWFLYGANGAKAFQRPEFNFEPQH